MQTKNLPLQIAELKAEGEGRRFSGYASKFNGVDAYGDTIIPGAYKSTLQDRDRPIQLRWNHYGPVIGKWLDVKEDDVGLRVEGELTAGHSVADDAYASLKHGAVDGLSIGYRVKDSDEENGVRMLKQIDLVEISVVEAPADLGARIGDVKSMVAEFEQLKEFEAMLRDAAGFSNTQAKAFVSRLKAVCLRDGEAQKPSEMDGVLTELQHVLKTVKGGLS